MKFVKCKNELSVVTTKCKIVHDIIILVDYLRSLSTNYTDHSHKSVILLGHLTNKRLGLTILIFGDFFPTSRFQKTKTASSTSVLLWFRNRNNKVLSQKFFRDGQGKRQHYCLCCTINYLTVTNVSYRETFYPLVIAVRWHRMTCRFPFDLILTRASGHGNWGITNTPQKNNGGK